MPKTPITTKQFLFLFFLSFHTLLKENEIRNYFYFILDYFYTHIYIYSKLHVISVQYIQ
jgi:hypothetical protein